jgi:hypothetical protein
MSVNLDELISMSEGLYWIVLSVVIATCVLWTIMAGIIIWRLDLKFDNSEFCVSFGMAAETALPIIGNAAFLPIISILLDVFLCTEAVGSHYTDSYMDRDCFVWCWEGEHIGYATMSSICLALYVPFAIYARPWWQFYQQSLSIYASPRFLMLKSVIQMFIIALSKTVGKHSYETHLFIFMIFSFAFFVHSLKFKPFNYARLSMWHSLSLGGVYWLALLNILDKMTSANMAYVILLFVGWAAIVGLGLVLQTKKYPSMLKTYKHPDLMQLYKFAWQPNMKVENVRIFRSISIFPERSDSSEFSFKVADNVKIQ